MLFLPLDRAADIAAAAIQIRETERDQAARMRNGTSLRAQSHFTDYLTRREREAITFRQHLRAIGGAIEE